ncbi:MAG: CDP-alcohol phosphatidyltransferase family protein [Oceanicaulis sp.]
MNRLLDRLPWLLVLFRAACAPAPWVAWLFGAGELIVALLIPLALLSDVFDGIVARRRGVATVLLRRADGWADLAFVLSYSAYALLRHGEALDGWWWGIAALAAFQLLATVQDFLRYGRGAAYHFYTAKLWAIPFYGVLFQLTAGFEPWLIGPTLAMGYISLTEHVLATRLIPVWLVDQPHIVAALKTYRAMRDGA